MTKNVLLASTMLAFISTAAMADETAIGKLTERDGMAIGAVYLQPVMMEPEHALSPEKADIHLETDVHALKENPNGFEAGSWIPYLRVGYTITKTGSDFKTEGMLMPMVADDGPHYGDNVKLAGAGKYHLTYRFEPPSANGFMRHVDKETGVGEWWQPFSLDYDFNWIGSTGKKGGY